MIFYQKNDDSMRSQIYLSLVEIHLLSCPTPSTNQHNAQYNFAKRLDFSIIILYNIIMTKASCMTRFKLSVKGENHEKNNIITYYFGSITLCNRL